MIRSLSLGLLASAISVASLPAIAQEDGSADGMAAGGEPLITLADREEEDLWPQVSKAKPKVAPVKKEKSGPT